MEMRAIKQHVSNLRCFEPLASVNAERAVVVRTVSTLYNDLICLIHFSSAEGYFRVIKMCQKKKQCFCLVSVKHERQIM